MIECFKNHQLRLSRFGLWTKQETVAVHITLRSWAARPHDVGFSATREDDKIHLPEYLVRKHHRTRDGKVNVDAELRVSSIGLSTNAFGDFSKCSVVTDLLTEGQIEELGQTAQEIWDTFTHQPQTGRLLVFSYVLALLCQQMVVDYNTLMTDFLAITQLERDEVGPHTGHNCQPSSLTF